MTAVPAPDPAGEHPSAGAVGAAAGRWWVLVRRTTAFLTRSLLVRVIAVTLTLSTIVMLILGLILQQQITTGLLRSKIDAATAEIDSARQTVQSSLSGADSDPSSLREQLRLALAEIGRADGSSDAQGSAAGVFEPVIVPGRIGAEADLSIAQPIDDVPAELRSRVDQGRVAYQYTRIVREGQTIPALVMGSPARTSTDSFEVYLIFPLAVELATVQVVQRTLVVGGAALILALSGIAALVAAQVVRPVRRAATTARNLAAGNLADRMPVSGPIELSTLARSFNGMAEAIRVQIRQLEEFGKLQRRFTSDVSHELRTPLTTVRMAADVLHEGRADFPPHLARSTELLVDELDRFESLLADLLEISRYDAGIAELTTDPIDIRSCIDTAVSAAGQLAEQFGIELLTRTPDEPVIAEIDVRRVDRILRNLLYNAIDHADRQPVEVELAADEDALAITVTDHGVGLRPGEAGLVFNRFWRADPSRQRHTGGTGLGLAISLEDARLHGGWLQASGAPGEGARFRLTLPRRHGGLITRSPLPLRLGSEVPASYPQGQPVHDPTGQWWPVGVRLMVEDGAVKQVPSDEELHPASVPSAGRAATLSSPDQPRADSAVVGGGGGGGAAAGPVAAPVGETPPSTPLPSAARAASPTAGGQP